MAALHPQVVHFTIVLTIIGVAFRLVSLIGKPSFASPAVMEHEEWGERTQTALLIVGAIEILGLVLRRSPKVRLVRSVAAVAGLAAVVCVYEAGEHGGEPVDGIR